MLTRRWIVLSGFVALLIVAVAPNAAAGPLPIEKLEAMYDAALLRLDEVEEARDVVSLEYRAAREEFARLVNRTSEPDLSDEEAAKLSKMIEVARQRVQTLEKKLAALDDEAAALRAQIEWIVAQMQQWEEILGGK